MGTIIDASGDQNTYHYTSVSGRWTTVYEFCIQASPRESSFIYSIVTAMSATVLNPLVTHTP